MFPATPPSVNRAAPFKSTPGRPGAQWHGAARLAARLHALLLPPTCLLCGAPGERPRPGDWPGPLELCAPCRATWPAAVRQPLPALFARTCVPWAYAWPVNQLVLGLKFHGERCHARLFGTLLGRERSALGAPWPDSVVPLPLHAGRLRERGYNQAAEVARHAARACGVPMRARWLERVRETRAQSGLGAGARAANVAGAFRATRPLAGARIALVDDVITTGHTAAAAAQALLQAGAAGVELWAVARAARRDVGGGAGQWPEA